MTSIQYGLLTGPAFMAVFSFSGLAAGWAADNLNRRKVIAVALCVWSLAIAATGFCTEYYQVLLARFVLGASEAFCPALCYSLIADYYPIAERATANGFFASGIYIGYGVASLSLIAIARYGWRMVCFGAGVLGAVFLLIHLVFVREPERALVIAKRRKQEEEDAAAAALSAAANGVDEDVRLENGASSSSSSSSYKTDLKQPLLTNGDDVSSKIDSSHDSPQPSPVPGKSSWGSLIHSIKRLLGPTDMRLLIVASALRMMAGVVLGAFLPPYFKKYFASTLSVHLCLFSWLA